MVLNEGIASATSGSQCSPRTHHDSRGATSFTCCEWTAAGSTIVTSSHQGFVQVWDVRDRQRCGLTLGQTNEGSQAPIVSLANNPAKSHVSVTGRQSGEIQEWDMRSPKSPTLTTSVDGCVTSIVYGERGSTVERLRFCTSSGKIFKLDKGECRLLYEEAFAEFRHLCTTTSGSDTHLFCSTSQEGLIYMSSSSKYY